MVNEAIRVWRYLHSGIQMKDTAIVLHTSCVNYTIDDLQQLAKMPFVWLLPDNVRQELELLLESRLFSAKASYILSVTKDTCGRSTHKICVDWDLEQLYINCQEPVLPKQIFDGTLLFVFGDLSKLEEFLHQSRELPEHFILINEGWSCKNGIARVYPLYGVRNSTVRHAKELFPGNPIPPARELTDIKVPEREMVISGEDLNDTDKYGSYAHIYTCSKFPDRYIKIYKYNDLYGNQNKKLQNLRRIGNEVNHQNLALPETILYRGKDRIIGYTMRHFHGYPLRFFLDNDDGWKGHDLFVIFRRLALLLLEMHAMHILGNDISFNNIIIGNDDKVHIVDCDSFQIFDYPGGGITEIYRHPEIQKDQCHKILREPRHEYFTFAVLLFQCLFYDEPLRQMQVHMDDKILNWNNAVFPLDIYGRELGVANKEILQLWKDQPIQIQKIFADVFHFRREHSIGSWIRALGLLDN